jgi:hypothetical protein
MYALPCGFPPLPQGAGGPTAGPPHAGPQPGQMFAFQPPPYPYGAPMMQHQQQQGMAGAPFTYQPAVTSAAPGGSNSKAAAPAPASTSGEESDTELRQLSASGDSSVSIDSKGRATCAQVVPDIAAGAMMVDDHVAVPQSGSPSAVHAHMHGKPAVGTQGPAPPMHPHMFPAGGFGGWRGGPPLHLPPHPHHQQQQQYLQRYGGRFAMTTVHTSRVARQACLDRYRAKKAKRMFGKKIRYAMRKVNADRRPRVKGRFVKVGCHPLLCV